MTEPIRSVHLYPKFREQDALAYALRTGVLGLGAGTFSACMKNAYFSTTSSAWGVLTIYGGTIPIYGAAFGTYGFVKTSMANFRRRNDAWNEFGGALSGAVVWGIFRRQKISNMIAISVLAGTISGLYAWAGGIGGLSTVYGVDLHEALDYRRKWRFNPTDLLPIEQYEHAIGRRIDSEDFAGLEEIIGQRTQPAVHLDVTGIRPFPPPKKEEKQWWQEVLEKARGESKEGVKK